MSKRKIDTTLKKSVIESFQSHKREVLNDFRQEERTRLDQASNDDMDNRHIESKAEETLNEMDFLTHSMEILEKEIYILKSIYQEVPNDKVEFGALLKTDKVVALIGVANERMDVEGIQVVGISLAAPLLKAMEGKKVGDTVEVNSVSHTIEEIC